MILFTWQVSPNQVRPRCHGNTNPSTQRCPTTPSSHLEVPGAALPSRSVTEDHCPGPGMTVCCCKNSPKSVAKLGKMPPPSRVPPLPLAGLVGLRLNLRHFPQWSSRYWSPFVLILLDSSPTQPITCLFLALQFESLSVSWYTCSILSALISKLAV